MRRVICILTFVLLFLSLGCLNANKHLLFNESIEYIQELDIMKEPVLIHGYDGKYSLKVEQGQAIKLIELQDHSVSLSLDNEKNRIVAVRIYEDAANILNVIQSCLKNGYYSNWENVPSAETPYAIHIYLSEEGKKLIPESNAIDEIFVSVSFGSDQETTVSTNSIRTEHYIPKGLNVSIVYKNGLNVSYLYGEYYDQTIVTWDEVSQEH